MLYPSAGTPLKSGRFSWTIKATVDVDIAFYFILFSLCELNPILLALQSPSSVESLQPGCS